MALDFNQGLLAFLRRTLDSPGLAFREPPKEIALGTEARIVKFTLRSAPREFAHPLVLRISRDRDYPIHPGLEHAVQNTVFEQGFPAPRVLASSINGAELGHPFTIMTLVDSRPPFFESIIQRQIHRLRRVSRWNSQRPVALNHRGLHIRTLAWLHNLDGRSLGKMFEAHKVPIDRLTEPTRFVQTQRMIEEWGLDSLRPLIQWLETNDPVDVKTSRSICHGDLHDGNLMIADGRVMGVIDWGEAGLRPPESDLGLLCGYRRCVEPLSTSSYDQQKFNEDLFAEYKLYRSMDEKMASYFEAELLISFMASVAVQINRHADGREPPGNPLLDNPATVPRLARRLKFFVGKDVFIPEHPNL